MLCAAGYAAAFDQFERATPHARLEHLVSTALHISQSIDALFAESEYRGIITLLSNTNTESYYIRVLGRVRGHRLKANIYTCTCTSLNTLIPVIIEWGRQV